MDTLPIRVEIALWILFAATIACMWWLAKYEPWGISPFSWLGFVLLAIIAILAAILLVNRNQHQINKTLNRRER